MSEYECAQGHLMKASDRFYSICGGGIAREDGKSARQLAAEESGEYDRKMQQAREEEGEEEEPEKDEDGE